ncbi:hypothetical protein E2562_016988 [Oryza meyeriana var. granulata]|uniref:Transposase MuDR plant domain-containing protein n=1 Tax=Oryza meyeriana var. granulata TaxID=110450 RepID=A0A6G1EB87_9ORYZ|nr:hypothetical protein E2562_016988 [Oryza meyeriana var. granulata]
MPDVIVMEEEYVGVNDEGLYIHVPPVQPPEPTQPSEHVKPCGAGQPHVEVEVTDADPKEINVLHNPKLPVIERNALFPDIETFRKAIRHYAIVKGFEFANLKTDPTRFIANCKHKGCKWCIGASRLSDNRTIQIKKLPFEHECPTTKLMEGKMATQGWIAARLGDWIKKNPQKEAKDAKDKLEEEYEIKLKKRQEDVASSSKAAKKKTTPKKKRTPKKRKTPKKKKDAQAASRAPPRVVR